MRLPLLCSLIACTLVLPSAGASEIRVSGGKVAGLAMDDGSTIYYGIPYAAAPTGALRWRPPAPRAPWRGTLDGTKLPPACVQGDIGWNRFFMDHMQEDCLILSIRTPATGAKGKLPVLVYIHGGSNAAASASGDLAGDAIHRGGVVLVKVQYRLGAFGFLGLDALRKESATGTSGNYALMDQIAALKWVRANIAAVGGDPGNVTISGNSAGAFDALLLTLSPRAKGLFHKAILQAPAPGAPRSAHENEAVGNALLDKLGLPRGAAGLARLRAMPAAEVATAAVNLPTPAAVDPSFVWEQQILDGDVLRHSYAEAYARGAGRGIPVILGSNHQELGAERGREGGAALIAGGFGPRAEAAMRLYGYTDGKPPPDHPLLGNISTQVLTDLWFRCPAVWLARKMAAATPRVWRYEFGFGAPGSGKPPEHTSEMEYVYRAERGDTAHAWPPIQRYWLNFLKSGDPNGAALAHWPRAGTEDAYLSMEPGATRAATDTGPRGAVCALLYQDKDYPQSSRIPQ